MSFSRAEEFLGVHSISGKPGKVPFGFAVTFTVEFRQLISEYCACAISSSRQPVLSKKCTRSLSSSGVQKQLSWRLYVSAAASMLLTDPVEYFSLRAFTSFGQSLGLRGIPRPTSLRKTRTSFSLLR